MNIDMLDCVKNRLNKFIRESSELVVVQFQPLQTENIVSETPNWKYSFRNFKLKHLFQIQSHSRILPCEVLKCWCWNFWNPGEEKMFSSHIHTAFDAKTYRKSHRLLSSQRFCKWSPNSSKSPSSNLHPWLKLMFNKKNQCFNPTFL